MNFRKLLPFGLLAVVVLGALALALPAGSAAAQSTTPPAPAQTQAQAARTITRLEKAFYTEKVNADKMALHLDQLDWLALRVSNLIDRASANGKDTSALAAALKAFKASEAEARTKLQSAQGLIQAHNGFGADGKVVNPVEAKETVKNVHDLLQTARKTVTQAAKIFRDAVKDWRAANPAKPKA